MRVVQVSPFRGDPSGGGAQQRIHGLVTGRGSNTVVRVVLRTPDGIRPGTLRGKRQRSFGDGYREVEAYNLPRIAFNFASLPFRHALVPGGDAFRYLWQPFESTLLGVSPPKPLTDALGEADAVLVEFPWQVPYVCVAAPEDTPVIYSSHNVETEYHDWLGGSCVGRAVLDRMASVEQRALRESDLVVTSSERDGRTYRSKYGYDADWHCAPNATYLPDIDVEPRRPATDGELTALFVGANHRPNVSAVEHIEQMATETTGIQFRIAGNVCSEFEAARMPENVTLLGYVDDLEREMLNAEVGLNPITEGSGSNIKLPEYLAYGLIVLTTPFGARGFQISNGKDALIRDLSAFPEALEALRDGELDWTDISSNARRLVETELNWVVVSERLFERLRTLSDGAP